jgi:hypothetical protein
MSIWTPGAGVCAAESDVVEPGAMADGDAAGLVDGVGAEPVVGVHRL